MATSIPPHNAGELCGALLHLIDQSGTARPPSWSAHVPGPDFPTGGVLVEPAESIAEAYATGRGSFRLRARWDEGAAVARPLPDRRHRDPVSGAEKPADREDRGAARREEAAAARRYPRRVGRARSALVLEPKNRNVDARPADGAAVPADRAGSPGAAQPQRDRPARRAAGDEPEGGAAGLSRPSP